MADVLSSGSDPGDPRHVRPGRRRRTTLLAGVLVAAGAAYLAVHTGSAGAPDPQAAPPSAQVRPVDPDQAEPPPAQARYRLDGDPGVGPAGLRMLVGGREPGVLDAGTGRISPLPLPRDTADVSRLDHAGGVTTAMLHNPGRLRARGVAIGPTGKAAQLGSLVDLVPLRNGTVLAEDCGGAGGSPPCTLTDFVRHRRGQLAADRDRGSSTWSGTRRTGCWSGRTRVTSAGWRGWRTPAPAGSAGSSAGRTRCSAPTTGRWSSSRPAAARTAG